MAFTSITEYFTAVFSPLKYVLLAYTMNGAGTSDECLAFAKMLGIPDLPGSSQEVWELYAKEEANTAEGIKASIDAGAFLPFERVCAVFGMSSFERFSLALTLAVETDPIYASAISSLGGRLTLSLLLRLFSSSAEECLGWQAEWLSKSDDLRLVFAETDLAGPVSLRTVVKKFLLGVEMTPQGVSMFTPDSPLPESLVECDASELILRQIALRRTGNMFVLTGAQGVGKKYQIKQFSVKSGFVLLFLPLNRIRDDSIWLDDLAAALALTGGMLCVSGIPPGDALPDSLLKLIWEVQPSNICITCEEKINATPAGYVSVPIPISLPTDDERLGIWQAYSEAYTLPEDVKEFATQYRFTIGQIESACILAYELAHQRDAESVTLQILHEACHRQFSHKLGSLAMPVNTYFTWDDIVLPPAQTRLLKHICEQVKYRNVVYGDWGFETKVAYGRGVRALFSGPPGTGKTMAAQVIASDLHMEMYKVDLSSLVSKYIGDTEKNLDEVFIQAAKSGGILFFDEADAIFGKRGEQKDSHDKYANMQTAFLLQRFEEYDGVVLLATNLASNLDPAFTRRIQNRIDFPVPSAEYRKQIWNGLLLKTAPFDDDIEIGFLAEKFDLTGSAIRNIVLQAAFLAAAAGNSIGMRELVEALAMEFSKTDKILSKNDLGEYGFYWSG